MHAGDRAGDRARDVASWASDWHCGLWGVSPREGGCDGDLGGLQKLTKGFPKSEPSAACPEGGGLMAQGWLGTGGAPPLLLLLIQ